MRRVVITGIGAVTPLGPTSDQKGDNILWKNLVAEKSAVKQITSLEGIENYRRNLGAEIDNWNIEDYFSPGEFDEKTFKRILTFDKALQFAMAATKLSLEDADLAPGENGEIGFYTGNGMQSIQSIEEYVMDFTKKCIYNLAKENKSLDDLDFLKEDIYCVEKMDPHKIFKYSKSSILNYMSYAVGGNISILFGFHGPSLAINTACSSGNDAIGQAYRAISLGDCEVIVAGGTEAPIASPPIALFNKMGIMSRRGVRSGDKRRDGFALGEGAGYLILEELEHARARRAKIYSEMAGYSQTNDGFHITSLDSTGRFVEKGIRKLLEQANLKARDVDYINPHMTSTIQCDNVESKVFRSVFGKHLDDIAVHPTKCYTGHFQAGAGAVESIMANLIMENDYIPGIPRVENPDPRCVSFVPPGGVEKRIHNALTLSLGFGGHNSMLLFKRYNGN